MTSPGTELTLPGAAAEGKTEQVRHVETPDGSRIEVAYPQLVGGDAALRNQVNGILRAAFKAIAAESGPLARFLR